MIAPRQGHLPGTARYTQAQRIMRSDSGDTIKPACHGRSGVFDCLCAVPPESPALLRLALRRAGFAFWSALMASLAIFIFFFMLTLGYTGTYPGFIVFGALIAAYQAAIIQIYHRHSLRYLTARGVPCGNCGYDLDRTPEKGRCPECGDLYSTQWLDRAWECSLRLRYAQRGEERIRKEEQRRWLGIFFVALGFLMCTAIGVATLYRAQLSEIFTFFFSLGGYVSTVILVALGGWVYNNQYKFDRERSVHLS